MNAQSFLLLAFLVVVALYTVLRWFFGRGGGGDCDGNCGGCHGGC